MTLELMSMRLKYPTMASLSLSLLTLMTTKHLVLISRCCETYNCQWIKWKSSSAQNSAN